MSDVCPSCSEAVVASDTFCEACGAALSPDAAAPLPPPEASKVITPAPATRLAARCNRCSGEVLDDGFCSLCGQKAPSARDHWAETPVAWVGGVCDKGILHARNEDAMALAGLADRSLGVLVVCDGVTTAPDSDRAALAAAKAACTRLVGTPPTPSGGVAAVISHWGTALTGACSDAHAATVGVARALGDPEEPPSCTFIAVVIAGTSTGGLATLAWCGDSRAYWLPDSGAPEQLMEDHSLGTEMVRAGMAREEAEADPTFHTITRWLGADSVDPRPELASRVLDGPGWVLVCSDGLWNYASSATAVAEQLTAARAGGAATPTEIADALVRWANEQGGHDNITAALGRWEPRS